MRARLRRWFGTPRIQEGALSAARDPGPPPSTRVIPVGLFDEMREAARLAHEFAGNVIRYSGIVEDDPNDHRSLLIEQAWDVVHATKWAAGERTP